MKETTALEWLYRWLNDNQKATNLEALEAFEHAKSIEKQQILNAHIDGQSLMSCQTEKAIKYYNDNYNNL